MVPFVVLALTYCLTLLWGRAPGRHTSGHGPGAGRREQAADGSPDAPAQTDGRHRQEAGARSARRPRLARIPAALFARRMTVGLILAAAVMAFAYFWPVYTGEVIPFSDWNDRMWNITWRCSASRLPVMRARQHESSCARQHERSRARQHESSCWRPSAGVSRPAAPSCRQPVGPRVGSLALGAPAVITFRPE